MTIIASDKLFYTHAWETYLIGGLIIFLIGLLLGWLLWRHCRAQAERVEEINSTLRDRKSVLADNNRQLNGIIEKIPKKPVA